jgi:hypothetical protein
MALSLREGFSSEILAKFSTLPMTSNSCIWISSHTRRKWRFDRCFVRSFSFFGLFDFSLDPPVTFDPPPSSFLSLGPPAFTQSSPSPSPHFETFEFSSLLFAIFSLFSRKANSALLTLNSYSSF